MHSLTKAELEQVVLMTGFRARRQPQERVLAKASDIWIPMFGGFAFTFGEDEANLCLWLALAFEIVWAAHKVGDLICLIWS